MKSTKRWICIFLLLLAAIYGQYIRSHLPENLLSYSDNLVITFVATLSSVIVGIYLYEYKHTRTTNDLREKLRKIIIAESQEIITLLKEGDRLPITIRKGVVSEVVATYLSSSAFEEAARSGLYDAHMGENLFHLVNKIKVYNKKVDHLLEAIRVGTTENIVIHAIDNLNETTNALLNQTQAILEKIN